MPVFGIPQAGGYGPPNQGLNVTSVQPGQSLVLFDGTEAAALDLASVAFARGLQGSSDNGFTINITGMPVGMTVDVQACSPPAGGFASVAAMGNAFSSVATIGPDANGNGFYTDVGRSAFYRLLISAYVSGTTPIAVVQR